MKIIIAEHSGFCFGVNRAMNLAWNTLVENDGNKPIYSVGPLIHNDQAMEKYIQNGLAIEEEVEKIEKKSIAIVRSHGLPKVFYDRMDGKDINIVDATCPFVSKIQRIVHEKCSQGYKIIIVGDKKHPEVIGINGWAENSSIVINSLEEASALDQDIKNNYAVVVQTTFNIEKYNEIETELMKRLKNVEFHNTICYATKERQDSALELSKKVDVMIVVGGRSSSNTKKLADICSKNTRTILVETANELDINEIGRPETIGISAGASTPDFIVEELVDFIVNKIHI